MKPESLNRRPILGLIVLCSSLLFCGPAHTAEIQARLSRGQVGLGESFQLVLEARQTPDGEPDFTPLERDFEILGRSQSQNIQMINGDFSRTTSWNLTLMAGRSGKLTIPPIAFGSDSSPALEIEVLPATNLDGLSGDDIFLTIKTDHDSVYQGQQILLTLQLYRAVDTENASLSTPGSSDPDLVIRKLGEDEQYEQRLKGRSYQVIERRYALFSQNVGTLNLEPFVFQGEVRPRGAGGSRFFGSPLGAFRQPGQIRRVVSGPLRVEVKAPPADRVPGPWLPSRDLQLQDSLAMEQKSLKVGEPMTRTLILMAEGLTAAQLPELVDKLPDGLKQYPDQPVLEDRADRNGITGIRQVKLAIVPSRAGSFTLPAIEVAWWNTAEGRMETSRLPKRIVRVEPAAIGDPQPRQGLPGVQAGVAKKEASPPPSNETSDPAGPSRLRWLTLFLGLGWLFTIGAWWLSRRKGRPRLQARDNAPPSARLGAAVEALRLSCLSNDPHAVAGALLTWAAVRWPESPPHSLGRLAKLVGDRDAALAIAALERRLYASESSEWVGAELWQTLSAVIGAERQTTRVEPVLIAPLYPD